MAYLGNSPARSFISFERQVFTIVNSQTAYTLDHSVTNENDIRLVVNNVVQEPGSGKAYTASGTTLTLSAALTNGTDEMYCVYLGRATATEAPGAGSVGTSQLASEAVTNAKVASTIITGQTAETTIASDDLILLSDTSASGALKKMTHANFVSGVGQTNTPYFTARLGSDQDIGYTGAYTKIQIDTEYFDSASAFDTSNYRFTPQTAGKYFVFGQCAFETTSSANNTNNLVATLVAIYKNGSNVAFQQIDRGGQLYSAYKRTMGVSTIVDMNGSSDYLELYGRGNSNNAGSTRVAADSSGSTIFGAYLLAT